MNEDSIKLKKDVLECVLNGVIVSCNDDQKESSFIDDAKYFYYQGLHDVAAVLILVCGERAAYGMLKKLVQYNLGDCTAYVFINYLRKIVKLSLIE